MVMPAGPTLLISLTGHAAPLTRAFYSKRLRPFTPGYRLAVKAEGAAQTIIGINYPGPLPGPNLYRIVGRGQADAASPFSYDLNALGAIPTGANPLPTDNAAAILPASGYVDAIATFNNGTTRSRSGSTTGPIERLGTGAANVTRQFWRVDSATTITVAFGYAGGVYQDLPKGWIMEIVVPDAATVTAGTTVLVSDVLTDLPSYDFLVNGDGTLATKVNIFPSHQ